MTTLSFDLRHAVRSLARAPGFTAVALLTLGVGVGVAGAVVNLARGVLLAPLPYEEPDRLVLVWATDIERDIQRWQPTVADFLDWRERSRTLGAVAPYAPRGFNLVGGGEPERVQGYRVGVDLFGLLGVEAALGRTFQSVEEEPGTPGVVLLGHDFWIRRYGGDREVLGTTVRLDDVPHTVVGVLPRGFFFPYRGVDLWVPFQIDGSSASRISRGMNVVARLAPGATLAQARSEMEGLAEALAREHPDTNAGTGVRVAPLHEELVSDVRGRILTLGGAVGILLLLTCANLMGLLLIRWLRRRQDLAVRTALGAPRTRQVRLLFVESLVLGLGGGVLGVAVAVLLSGVTGRFVPDALPVGGIVGLGVPLLLCTLGVAVAAALLFGVTPALGLARTSPATLLRDRGGGASRTVRRVQSGLVVLEVAMALTLGVGAGLLYRTVDSLYAQDLGFRPEGVLVARVQPPVSRYPGPEELTTLLDQVLERVRALPGVEAAGFGSFAPLTWSGAMIYYRPPGWVDSGAPPDLVYLRLVTPGYFDALGARVVGGRDFESGDRRPGEPVAVVNEAFVRRYLADEPALGTALPVDSYGLSRPTVVGVVEDIRIEDVDVEPGPVLYMAQAQVTRRNPSYDARDLVLRVKGDPASPGGSVRAVLREVDPSLPVEELRTLDSVLDATLETSRFQLRLLLGFAAFAVLLACLGTFGVVSYGVQTRLRDIGIRMALGARGSEVRAHIVWGGLRLVVAGVLLGTAASLLLGRFLEALLYQTSPRDPPTLLAVSGVVTLAVLLASYLPARRASRLDPMRVLRRE